jgi:hypothetical protein
MNKLEAIERIKSIIREYGSFNTYDIDDKCSICVGSLGKFVALAEDFYIDEVNVRIYNPSVFSSDAEDEYTMTYEDFDLNILAEILNYCEEWEAKNLKTEKRIN